MHSPEGSRFKGGSSLEVLSGIRNRAGLSTGGSTVGMSSSHSMPLVEDFIELVGGGGS